MIAPQALKLYVRHDGRLFLRTAQHKQARGAKGGAGFLNNGPLEPRCWMASRGGRHRNTTWLRSTGYGFFWNLYTFLMFFVKKLPLDSAAMSWSYTSWGTPMYS